MKSSLYITYDGLSDQLGGSQILPYVKYLASQGCNITILSCEKTKYLTDRTRSTIKADLAVSGINWEYVLYTKYPPILSGVYDRWKLLHLAKQLFKKTHFDIIHCRSYLPAIVGLSIKQYYKKQKQRTPKIIFDMRGFWADEKVEVGAWPQSNPIFRTVYNYFKKMEAKLIKASDHIVILTRAGANELSMWPTYSTLKDKPPITVIPCCVDTDHFKLVTSEERAKAKIGLGFKLTSPVIGYLGGIGGWYMLDEMLTFLAGVKLSQPQTKMLFITRSDPNLIYSKLSQYNLEKSDVLVRPAKREEVPGYLAAMDLGLSFILPTYAKIASSPTKQAEYLACGIPIVTNDKIGDNLTMIGQIRDCHVLENMEIDTINSLAFKLKVLPTSMTIVEQEERAKEIREACIEAFSLVKGGSRYQEIYEGLK